MAQTYRQRFLAAMRANERDMSALFRDLHAQIVPVLLRHERASGGIEPAQSLRVRDEVGALVTGAFLQPTSRGAVAPFEVRGRRVVPLSRYAVALWAHIDGVTRLAVEQHAAIMRRQLRRAPDVLAAFMTARRDPFQAARATVSEQAHWKPRPFLDYDPYHRFVDPRGYTLSTKIWDTSAATRRKIDLYLSDAIAQGKGAREMAAELERFLLPGRGLVKTRKPYGTTASYDAMRLARTEITAAHGRAGLMGAYANPFVTGVNWVRSSSRRPCTSGICDMLEAGSPYTLENVPNLPGDSHPHCMCRYEWLIEDTAAVIEDLRTQLDDLLPFTAPPSGSALPFALLITPLLVETFTRLLLDEPEPLTDPVYLLPSEGLR